MIWTQGRGQTLVRRKLSEQADGIKWETAMSDHKELVDLLSTLDDQLAENIIQHVRLLVYVSFCSSLLDTLGF